jgi:hypothetical protein
MLLIRRHRNSFRCILPLTAEGGCHVGKNKRLAKVEKPELGAGGILVAKNERARVKSGGSKECHVAKNKRLARVEKPELGAGGIPVAKNERPGSRVVVVKKEEEEAPRV